ncbi:MAG: AzlC family ABC transporter permease [Victivallaceae bacterium]|nr:AzlC family ABC transporter permease [Victivallaceae bacterium]
MTFDREMRDAFFDSLPVLMGYLSMGMAFGVLLVTQVPGANAFWAFGMSASTISGSMQFAAIEMLKNAVLYSLGLTFLLSCLINIRYSVYALGFIRRFKTYPWYIRWYLVLGLTDETYAIACRSRRRGKSAMRYHLCVTAFDHFYWVAGSVLGAAAGRFLKFDTAGMEFAMTALFLVILVDLVREKENRIPALIGGISTAVVLIPTALCLPGHTNKILLPAMLIMTAILLLLRKRREAHQ